MELGTLNRRVTIQQRNGAVDAIGQLTETWTDVVSVWANIKHLSGYQSIKAGAESSTVKSSIRIRYRSGITTAMRVIHGVTVYNIVAVLPDEQSREYVDLVCEVCQ